MTKSKADAVKEALRARKPEAPPPARLSSGSTLLNLACSGNPHWAFEAGRYYLMVGGSEAGKSWELLQIFAEACRNREFDQHRIVLVQPERGARMDRKRYFGAALDRRIETPEPPKTLEGFYDLFDDLAKEGRPFICGLDSEDSLDSEAELERRKAAKSLRRGKRKSDEGTRSYGTEKAKINSGCLRTAHNALADSGSMLFIVKQSRSNIGRDAMFNPETRNGGIALTFYADLELWFSVHKAIRRKATAKKTVEVGTTLRIKVKKNRVAGTHRAVDLDFYPGVGIDEIGSMVNWLVDWGFWESKGKDGSSIVAPEFDHEGSRESLVVKVEKGGLEKDLRLLLSERWAEVEAGCRVERKPRYV